MCFLANKRSEEQYLGYYVIHLFWRTNATSGNDAVAYQASSITRISDDNQPSKGYRTERGMLGEADHVSIFRLLL
jgi:hypothetical protein